MPIRAYYNEPVSNFIAEDPERILGVLTFEHHHPLEQTQTYAWRQQIAILKNALLGLPEGRIFLEFYIPRMGKRVDAVLISTGIVFVIEFKVGSDERHAGALDQVQDYALDLKNFHEGSHAVPIVPVLVATSADSKPTCSLTFAADLVASTVETNATDLGPRLFEICGLQTFPRLDVGDWMSRGYRPTPTIVEAAEVLYRTHSVTDISRSDAGAKNLQETSAAVSGVIDRARQYRRKAICFVTGVPGSGKTLAGLNIAEFLYSNDEGVSRLLRTTSSLRRT